MVVLGGHKTPYTRFRRDLPFLRAVSALVLPGCDSVYRRTNVEAPLRVGRFRLQEFRVYDLRLEARQRNHQVCFLPHVLFLSPFEFKFFLWCKPQFLLPRMMTNLNDDARNRAVRSQI